MTDIDFDELDRAVNSLIGAKPVSDTPAPTTPGDTSTSVQVTNGSAPQSSVPSPAAMPPLATRRTSGRFMDVVHPSSDMRTSPPAQTPAAAAMDPVAPSMPTVLAPAMPDTQPHDMPDPLDFHGFDAPTPDSSASSVAAVSTTPLETPFIADAKVEKRPLGAFSAAPAEGVPPVEMESQPSTSIAPEASADTPAVEPEKSEESANVDTPLPAELGDDLLSIESNETISQQSEVPVAVAAATPTQEQPPVVSITQQYTESPSTGDAPATTSIFDTDAYKKPLAHPKKKSSGWLVVLWIALLLIVGAGAGAAVYFYVLPLL